MFMLFLLKLYHLFFILFSSVSFSFRSFHCCIFKLTDSHVCCVQAAHELIKNIFHFSTLFLIFKHFLLIFRSFSLSHLTLLICFEYCPLFFFRSLNMLNVTIINSLCEIPKSVSYMGLVLTFPLSFRTVYLFLAFYQGL